MMPHGPCLYMRGLVLYRRADGPYFLYNNKGSKIRVSGSRVLVSLPIGSEVDTGLNERSLGLRVSGGPQGPTELRV